MHSTSYFSLTVGRRFLIQSQAEARMKSALEKKKKSTLISVLIILICTWNEPIKNIWNNVSSPPSTCLVVTEDTRCLWVLRGPSLWIRLEECNLRRSGEILQTHWGSGQAGRFIYFATHTGRVFPVMGLLWTQNIVICLNSSYG